jgi:hypothetical protein
MDRSVRQDVLAQKKGTCFGVSLERKQEQDTYGQTRCTTYDSIQMHKGVGLTWINTLGF